MTAPATIRAYRPSDRDAVRRIALETSGAASFPDPELLVDQLTRYYTDCEPGSLWVAELDARVVGYLSGCLITWNFLRWLKFQQRPRVLLRLLTRHAFHPFMWRWAASRVKTLRAGGAHQPAWVERHPAHLHMNLTERARGQKIGSALVEKFLDQARGMGLRGVHLPTKADNADAQRFFSRHGFKPIANVTAYRPSESGGFIEVPVLIMALRW